MEQSEIVNLIIETINTIFNNIFSSIDNNLYANLDNIVFIDSNILSTSFFEKILGSNGKSGFIYLADALLLGISLFYSVKLYYSHFTETNIEKPYQFLFKLLLFAILINYSYFLMEQILKINYIFSSSIQEIGKSIVGNDISFSELISKLNTNISINQSSINIFSLEGVIKSFISIGLINLLFTYSLRYIIIQIFILICPFVLLSLINTSTSWIFNSWIKCLFSLLIMQSFIPLIIIIIFSIDFENKILIVSGIFLLTKINNYVKEIFGGVSIEFSGKFSNMISLFRK